MSERPAPSRTALVEALTARLLEESELAEWALPLDDDAIGDDRAADAPDSEHSVGVARAEWDDPGAEWGDPGSWDRVSLIEVLPDDDSCVIAFSWRGNRRPFLVRVPWPESAIAADEWATQVDGWLHRGMRSGSFPRLATRRIEGVCVALSDLPGGPRAVHGHAQDVHIGPVSPSMEPLGWDALPLRFRLSLTLRGLRARLRGTPRGAVAYAPLAIGDPSAVGRDLEELGLDVDDAREAMDSAQAVEWLVARRADQAGEVLGHALVGEVLAGVSEVTVEQVDGAPAGSIEELVRAAVMSAGDAGALSVTVPAAAGSPRRHFRTDLLIEVDPEGGFDPRSTARSSADADPDPAADR